MSLQLSSKNVQLRLLDTRRRNFRRSLRGMEQLESRQLLAGNLSLAGTAFVDTNNDGTLNTGEAYLPDAEIDLFSGDGMTQLGMTHTDAQGAYRFDNLEPGNYQLLNRSALWFEATATQVLSTINPAGADPLDGSELIDVTLMDPADLQASIDFDRFFSPSWGLERGPMTVQIDGFQGGLYSGALPLTLHSTALSPNPSSEIQSLCID